jgi:hypothetical protein
MPSPNAKPWRLTVQFQDQGWESALYESSAEAFASGLAVANDYQGATFRITLVASTCAEDDFVVTRVN